MRRLLIASAVAIAAAAPAQAQTVGVTFVQGSYALTGTATVFQNFDNGTGADSAYTPLANESKTGDVRSESNTVPGLSVDPDNTAGNKYLSVRNGSYTVNLGGPVQVFSFILGSLDNYNKVTLFFANSTSLVLTGSQIVTSPGSSSGPIGPVNSSVAGRVTYDVGGGSGITSVAFASGAPAFEIDDLASAVPEPATWGMMILGFGLIGSQLRSRRGRKTTLATA